MNSQDKKNILRIGVDTQNELKLPKGKERQFGPQIGFGPMVSLIRKIKPKTNIAIGTRYYYYLKTKTFHLVENNIEKTYSEKHSIWFNYIGIANKVKELNGNKSIWLGGRIGTGTVLLDRTSNYVDFNKKSNNTIFAWGIEGTYHYSIYNTFGFSYLKVGKADFLLFMIVYDLRF